MLTIWRHTRGNQAWKGNDSILHFFGGKGNFDVPQTLEKKSKTGATKINYLHFLLFEGNCVWRIWRERQCDKSSKKFFLHLLWKEVLVGLVVRPDHHLTPTVFQMSDVLLVVSIGWTFSGVFQNEKESVKNEVHAIVCAHAFWGQNVFCKTQATHAHIPTTVSLTPDVLLRANTIQFTFTGGQ